jgi:hypothetical protein
VLVQSIKKLIVKDSCRITTKIKKEMKKKEERSKEKWIRKLKLSSRSLALSYNIKDMHSSSWVLDKIQVTHKEVILLF